MTLQPRGKDLSASSTASSEQSIIAELNAPTAEARIAAAGKLADLEEQGELTPPETSGYVNNHIHTIYSFSPYSPAKAVWTSRAAGLAVSGIVDHDSVSGVREFRQAGRALGFPTTAGFELRSDHTATSLGDRRTNNPDQAGVSYMTFHGLRDSALDAVSEFLAPVSDARGERNRAMCARLADLSGLDLNYDRDVVPLSRRPEGGSVTERHLLCALSLAAIREYGGADAIFDYLETRLNFKRGDTDKLRASWQTSIYGAGSRPADSGAAGTTPALTDTCCPYGADFFLYDLIGVLKANLVESFYIPAGPVECPPLAVLVEFARAHDIIITYPYLGDVTASVTGDKRAQSFEDSYIGELFDVLEAEGVSAISYMPARNTREQAERVRELADRHGMLQISGEDINSPRQPFISEASKDPYFANLRDTTWRLVKHESGEINLL
jgi:hypothetical protein